MLSDTGFEFWVVLHGARDSMAFVGPFHFEIFCGSVIQFRYQNFALEVLTSTVLEGRELYQACHYCYVVCSLQFAHVGSWGGRDSSLV